MTHNINSFKELVKYVGALPKNRRMVRLSSDCLPLYTHKDWRLFWRQPSVERYCERGFSEVGEIARAGDVRLSFHPGQFTVLASDNPDIVDRSIEEFEYHATMAKWMGYGRQYQDFKINVHISGKQGPRGIKDAIKRLSPEARNCITIENDENKWGIDDSLELQNECALVPDLHHHWVREGEYIRPADDRIKRVIDSWRGVRPVLHYSYSRSEWVGHVVENQLPDRDILIETGIKKGKLRAHSDWYPNVAANEWALSFSEHFDVMCESKMKNLASKQLYNQWRAIDPR